MKKIILLVLFSLLSLLMISCSKNNAHVVTIATPAGAPAISIYKMYNNKNYKITDNVNPQDELPTLFASNNYDVIMAPVNMGANLYSKNKSTYRLLGVVSWGNLYLASKLPISSDMSEWRVHSFGEKTINQSILEASTEKKPTITYDYTNAQEAIEGFLKSSSDIYVVAEPSLTLAKTKIDKEVYEVSLSSLYEKFKGDMSYPQAGCFVSENFINSKSFNSFKDDLISSCDSLSTNLSSAAESVASLKLIENKDIAITSIPRTNIMFKNASEAKPYIENVCSFAVSFFGGVKPNEEFYI